MINPNRMATVKRLAFPAVAALAVSFATPVAAANCGTGVKACVCGDTVTANWTMTQDVSCSTSAQTSKQGLIITAGKTVDGLGLYKIKGPREFGLTPGSSSYGVYMNNVTGAVLKNVEVRGFKVGARLNLGGSHVLDNVKLNNNSQYGIDINGSINNQYISSAPGSSVVSGNLDEGIHIGPAGPTRATGNTVSGIIVQNNTREQIYLLLADSNTLIGNTTSGGTTSLYVKDSDLNVFKSNTFNDQPVIFTGDSNGNKFGDAGVGNTINGARLEFHQYSTSSATAHDNTALLATITNTGGSYCVNFKGTTALPYANRLSGMTCKSSVAGDGKVNAVQASSGAVATQHRWCAATCLKPDGSSGTCRVDDPGEIVLVQTDACVP